MRSKEQETRSKKFRSVLRHLSVLLVQYASRAILELKAVIPGKYHLGRFPYFNVLLSFITPFQFNPKAKS